MTDIDDGARTPNAGTSGDGIAEVGLSTAPRWTRLKLLVRMPLPLTCVILLFLLTLAAIFGPFVVGDVAGEQNIDLRFHEPFSLDNGGWYLLGGDALGRSVLAQLIVGARATFLVAGAAVALSAVTGFLLGIFSGYSGRWVDAGVMRISDVLAALPSLLLALAVLFVLSPSMRNLVLVLAVARLPVYMRVARAQALEIKERTFIEASRSIGCRSWRILLHDVRPLVVPTILTVAVLEVAAVMLAAAGLSFLGVGLQRPDIDWGSLVAEGRDHIASAWWVTFFPGLAIVVTALAANIVSNWLRAVGDPLQGALLAASATTAPRRGDERGTEGTGERA